MATPTIDALRAVGDFALKFRWNLAISQFPALGTWPSSDDLNIRCESAELPKKIGSSTEIKIRGHKVKQPAIYGYTNSQQFTFVETIDNKISAMLKQWSDLAWTPQTGVSNQKSQIQGQILLQRLDNQNNAIWQYTMVGCYLENYDPGGQLGGDAGEALKPSIQLSYDYFLDNPVG
jgi:hypothetical protein